MTHHRRDVPGGLGLSLGLRVGGPLLGEGETTPLSIFGSDLELWSSGLRSGGILRDTGAGETSFDPLSSAPPPVGGYVVKEIDDLSGNGRDFEQLTTSHQLVYNQSTGFLSGFTANTHLDGTAFTQAQPYMIAFVLTMPNPGVFQVIAESLSSFRRMRAFTNTDDTFGCGSDTAISTTALTPGQTYSFITIMDGANGEIFVDGVSNVTGNVAGQTFDNGMTWFNGDAFNLGFQSNMGETVLSSGAPTAQQIADLAAYFASDWGF